MHLPTIPSNRNARFGSSRQTAWNGSSYDATTALRESINRAARRAGGFRIYGAHLPILYRRIKGRAPL